MDAANGIPGAASGLRPSHHGTYYESQVLRQLGLSAPDREEWQMKTIVTTALLACMCVGLVAAANTPQPPSKGSNVVETLEQLEQDLGDAIVAVDVQKLNQILADDWEAIGL